MTDDARWIVIDEVTRAQIYAGEHPRAEAETLAARLAPGYRYRLVRVVWSPTRAQWQRLGCA